MKTTAGKCRIAMAWTVAALMVGAADRYDWTGAAGDGLFLTPENWVFGGATRHDPLPEDIAAFIPGNNEVRMQAPDEELVLAGRVTLGCSNNTYLNPAKLTIGPGHYRFFRFNVGADADIQTSAINTAGELVIEEGAIVEVKNGDCLRVAYSLTNMVDNVESSVYVKGGELNLTGGNVQLGWESRGNLFQTGGLVSNAAWFSIGRAANGSGYYDLSGGTFKHTNATEGVLVGEDGRGTLVVRGTGVADVLGQVTIGNGTVNIEAGGTFKVSAFRARSANHQSVLNLDGGTLVMQGNTLRRDLVRGLAQVNMLPGGITVEIPTGYRGDFRQPITGGAGSGGLVKTGSGTLYLPDGNTYDGITEVREGTLLLASMNSIDQSKLVVAEGASVGVESSGWSLDEIKAFIDGVTGDLPLDVVAGETLVIDFPIGANVANVVKTGTGTLILTGANLYTGRLYVREGLVQADFGAGIPATGVVVFEGGTLAPFTATAEGTVSVEAPTFDISNGPIGFTAIGHDLTVNLEDGATLLSTAGATLPKGSLYLNAAEATNPLTFLNPVQMGLEDVIITTDATAPEAKVTMAGGVTVDVADTNVAAVGRWFYKRGAGTLVFTGEAPFKLPGHQVTLQGGTTIFEGEGHEGGWTQMFDCNGTVILTNATYTSTSEFLVGQGAGYKGEAYLYDSTLDTASWIAVGRFGGGEGYMKLDNSNVRVRSNNLGLGDTALGVVEQNGGTVQIDTGTIWIGEWDNNDAYVGHGRYVLNGGTLTAGTADPSLTVGNYGPGELIVNAGTVNIPKRTYLGRQTNADSQGTFEVHGGTVYATGEFRVGYRGPNNLFVQDGGEFYAASGFLLAYESGSSGTFQMTDGLFTANALFSVGRNGPGLAEMSGGELNMLGADDLVLGRYNIGTGSLTVSGGRMTYAADTRTSYIGREGKGVLTVTGDGCVSLSNTVYLAYGSSSSGELRVGGNGVFEAKKINFRKGGPRKLSANGGTIRVIEGNSGAFFSHAADGDGKDLTSTYIGVGGLTFDVGANDVELGDLGDTSSSEGTLRKVGSGLLTLKKFPYLGGGIAVQEGSVKLAENVAVGEPVSYDVSQGGTAEENVYPAEPSEELLANNYLSRRMKFDGSLVDELTGSTGKTVGNAIAGLTSYTLPNGADQSSYLDLGRGYLPRSAYATLELWVTVRDGNNNWSKIFSFGSGQDNNLMLGCSYAETGTPTATIDGNNVDFTTLAGDVWTWTDCVKYHVSIVVRPNPGNADLCDTVWTIRDGVTGGILSRATCTTARSLLNLGADHCWFGRSEWTDVVPNVELHEFRVWEAALSQAQLTQNVVLGADTLPTLTEKAVFKGVGAIDLAAGTTFDLNGNTLEGVGLAGAGTLVGPGTLVVSEHLTPNGALTLNGDVKLTGTLVAGDDAPILVNGTLDVTGADAVYTGTPKYKVLATVGEGGSIKGQFRSYTVDSPNYMIFAMSDRIVVKSKGSVVILR